MLEHNGDVLSKNMLHT